MEAIYWFLLFTLLVGAVRSHATTNVIKHTDIHDSELEGHWVEKTLWKSRWVKHWRPKYIYVPIWKKVWSPVIQKEWIPIPKAEGIEKWSNSKDHSDARTLVKKFIE